MTGLQEFVALDLGALEATEQERLLHTIMRAKDRAVPIMILWREIGECALVMPDDWSEERQLAWVARHRGQLEALAGEPWESLERV